MFNIIKYLLTAYVYKIKNLNTFRLFQCVNARCASFKHNYVCEIFY